MFPRPEAHQTAPFLKGQRMKTATKAKPKPAPKPEPKPEQAKPSSPINAAPISNGVLHIPIEQILANSNQPRQTWSIEKDDEGRTALERLAESIREHGILQPLVVTPRNGRYMIVCGERRYRAAKQLATFKTLPCTVKNGLNEREMMELSVTENLQREDLTPIDQARAYRMLIDKCGYTVRSLAKKLGLSAGMVSMKLSVLKLSPELQADIRAGKLTESQGTVIAQAVNKKPVEERAKAMQDIKHRIDAAKSQKPKLDTKDVKAIAKTTTSHASPSSNSKAKARKPRIKPPSPGEKKQASQFLKLLERFKKDLKPFEKHANPPARRRFAEVLTSLKKDIARTVQDSVSVLGKLYPELTAVEKERQFSS
jgi:ParB/RepB/Spo0J family partition protein